MIDEAVRNAKTIPEMFLERVRATPDAKSHEFERDGKWVSVSYREFGEQVKHATLGFAELGIKRGDNVAIWGDTTAEWTILDVGALSAGASVAGVYQSSTAEQVSYILNDARSNILCVDTPDRFAMALELKEQLPLVTKVVYWNAGSPAPSDWVMSIDDLLEQGKKAATARPGRYEELVQGQDPDAAAVLIYTSGTTGMPKGVILSHENCLVQCRAAVDNDFLKPGDRLVSFLPMSHVAEHAAQFMGRVYTGLQTTFCPNMQDVARVMKEKPPTLLVAVPRLYEKIRQKILSNIETAPPKKQRLARWALDIGDKVAKHKAKKESVPFVLGLQHKIADKIVLSKIREAFGGQVRIMLSAAAPIDVETIEFFQSLGVTFLEAYGLSECGGASHANRPNDYKNGTVGLPIRSFECKIAEDGEILLHGPGIFKGYLNKPEATAECLDADGWLHTGDIGVIDEDGFLRITDRKKNLLITAGGKNVAPAGIEMLIKREPVISQVVVLGDRKPYLSALLTLSREVIDSEKLSRDQVEERVKNAIDNANLQLARYEQIKKYKVLDEEFSVESGEMTPTMKIKRNVVMKKNEPVISALYGE
ncbi:MAG: long-chain fatty acid--CoA ligase [Candidatus Hydrogenedentes bacterium]|nr:long-chain fatty acid--CoA ligase [Candidatus Hydrogenedentota bacterium]